MKKLLKWIGIILVIVVVVLGVVVTVGLEPAVKAGVNRVGPSVVGVPVTLADADIRLLRGSVNLDRLVVGNPEGYKSDHAFSLGNFSIKMQPRSVLTDTVRINEIVIDEPQIVYEMSLTGSNLRALLKGMERKQPAADETAGDAAAPSAETKAVEIDRLVISNGKIRLTSRLLQGKTVNLPLPRIELTDVGKQKDKASITDVVRKVIVVVVQSSTTVVTQSGKLLTDGAGALIKAGTDGATAAIGLASNTVTAAGQTLTKSAGMATETAGKAASATIGLASNTVTAAGKTVGKSARVATDTAGKAASAATDTVGKGVSNVAGAAARGTAAAAGAAGKTVKSAGKAATKGASAATDAAAKGAKTLGKGATAVGGAVGKGADKVIGGLGGLLKRGDDDKADGEGAETNAPAAPPAD